MGVLVAIAKGFGGSKVGKWAVKKAPQILLGTGIVSGAGAIVGTAYATKKSIEDIEVEKMRRSIEQNIPVDQVTMTMKEKTKLVWKNFIAPATMAVGAVGAHVASFKLEHGRALSAAALLSATNSKLALTEAEMIEKLGEKKTKEIQAGVTQREIEQAKVGEPDTFLYDVGGSGEYWILDPVTKLEFRGTKDKIDLVVANCDHVLEIGLKEGEPNTSISVADLLEGFDVEPWKIPTFARNMVWRAGDTCNIGVKAGVGRTSKGEPCYVLDYHSVKPSWDDMWDISSY